MNRSLVILVDAREKRPLPIPEYLPVWDRGSPPDSPRTLTVRITVRHTTLITGDYALEGFERACLIERKGHLTELASNLMGPDRPRFLKALSRLRDSCEHPVLLLEGDPLTLANTLRSHNKRPPPPPFLIRDLLLSTLREYNVELMLVPTASLSARRAAGEWLVSKLIAGACHDHGHFRQADHLQPHDPEHRGGDAPHGSLEGHPDPHGLDRPR